ncbi:tyrosine protein phosphatase 1 [Saxophila tyrrhenica]|uniref:Tyrosine protein phosphatase 1 n=1 Tax=Saxophila tyrrhenica TaxID=1690608 RepID=A0AAV9PIG3_9PEZI|nr:tyrosine protein phosphatase 1 [Saxophila tyrrhenica]
MASSSTPSDSQQQQLPGFLRQSKADIHAKFTDLEWQQRNRLLQGTQPVVDASEPPSQWSRLTGDAIKGRNRYLNVEPYAGNRIKLRVAEGANDYINASPIQLGQRKYIATQGPKDTSVGHFYRMLAAEVRSPAVVVMLTQTHESGKEKCFQYYPLTAEESPLVIPEDETAPDGFTGEVTLEAVADDERSRSQLRRLKLQAKDQSGADHETDIRHLLFSGWPDFLIPEGEDRDALIKLIRLSASLNRPESTSTSTETNGSYNSHADSFASTEQDNPRIIHCSAGVGRSGTFIALDFLLSLLHSNQLDGLPEDVDPIADTVDSLRQQRMMMVQGESQYNFLYEVLREQMLARLDGSNAAAGAQS